jgi:multidrug efflux pump subunit AcrA (membrane-fusion protein)
VLNAQGTLEERKVQLGLEGSTRIEVLSGLQEGDRVVIGSRSEFRNGMKVQPKEVDPGGPAGGAQ